MIYVYKCKECGREHDISRSIENRDQPYECSCGNMTVRKYVPFRLCMNAWEYSSENKLSPEEHRESMIANEKAAQLSADNYKAPPTKAETRKYIDNKIREAYNGKT